MNTIPTFEEYIASLTRLTPHVDPTAHSTAGAVIKSAAQSLGDLSEVSVESLAEWVAENPTWVPALGLAVGLSQEKLKGALQHRFGTSGWQTLARQRAGDLITTLDNEFDLVRLVSAQRDKNYDFGDILVARGGPRLTATRAGASGRQVEDEIEAIAKSLSLAYESRTRFTGRSYRTAPCDLVIPSASNASIAVAAKGFDSTGSKQSDAVREVQEMAGVRTPRQFIIAVIDGIGWLSRKSDLRKIYDLWCSSEIDGMYTLDMLDSFRDDIMEAARMRNLF